MPIPRAAMSEYPAGTVPTMGGSASPDSLRGTAESVHGNNSHRTFTTDEEHTQAGSGGIMETLAASFNIGDWGTVSTANAGLAQNMMHMNTRN